MTKQLHVRLRTKNLKISILFGLLIVAFIIVFAYLYTQLLEKRIKVTRIV